MPGWAEKTRAGLDKWFTEKPGPDKPSWSERIALWGMGVIAKGAVKSLENMEPESVDLMRAQLIAIRDNPLTPQLQKDIINKLLAGTKPIPVLILVILGAIMLIPTIVSIFRPVGNLWEQQQEQVTHSFRFDPISVITAWRRDPEKYAKYFGDLKDMGWSDERMEALKFFTEFLPSPRDLVEWEAKEVFEPAMVEKYGLADEFETLDLSLFAKVGVTPEQARNFWIAHWEHASWLQVVEMLRRGQLKEEDVWDWFRLVEIPPFWRQKLINISWEVPTRVDVRRFWDMRTIDEARLREVYTAIGYHGKDLDDYVLWTKIYTDFPDLLARYKNGWITLDQVKSELVAMGMKPERADTMIEEKIKKAAPERVAKERELTAAEIIKGVKKEVISWAEGQELLMDMGYDESEAAFKLAIELAVMAGSPENYAEFKDLTQKYRKASGLEGKPMNEEIRKAAAEVIRLTSERDSLQRSITEEQRGLIGEEILPAEATARLKTLKASLRKAEAALSTAKTEYNRLVAEGKFA